MNSKEAINRLIKGNNLFIESKQEFPNLSDLRREELAAGQRPFAVIISCSDSRVPPEIIFDCGLGDLFVIRNAGNIVDDIVIGSVEYAVSNLGTELVVVLGHSECGAVKAAVEGAEDSEAIKNIVYSIKPAVDVKNPHDAVTNNVKLQANRLKTSGIIIPDLLNQGKINIIGGHYDLKSGKVNMLEI